MKQTQFYMLLIWHLKFYIQCKIPHGTDGACSRMCFIICITEIANDLTILENHFDEIFWQGFIPNDQIIHDKRRPVPGVTNVSPAQDHVSVICSTGTRINCSRCLAASNTIEINLQLLGFRFTHHSKTYPFFGTVIILSIYPLTLTRLIIDCPVN